MLPGMRKLMVVLVLLMAGCTADMRSLIKAIEDGDRARVEALISANPGLVNEDAEGKAWLFKIRLSKPAELDALMDRAAYDDFVANG